MMNLHMKNIEIIKWICYNLIIKMRGASLKSIANARSKGYEHAK